MFVSSDGAEVSFDLFLQSFKGGKSTPADKTAAKAVIDRFQYRHEPEFGAFDVTLSDGSHVEMYAQHLVDDTRTFEGAMIALRGLTESIACFIYDFSHAAGLVIFLPSEHPAVLVPRGDLSQHLPENIREGFAHVRVASGAELFAALRGDFKGWSSYRDQIVKGAS